MMMSNPNTKSEIIRTTILELLSPRLLRSGLKDGIAASTQLLEIGLIDSKDLLDLILEVEERCAVEFDPEHIDFEAGLTFGSLISAFATP
jgi:acyl carrier protein